MTETTAYQVVAATLRDDALDAMLLERPPYVYRSHWSPADVPSDITELLRSLYTDTFDLDRVEIRRRLGQTLERLAQTYEGLEGVASCLLFESGRLDGRSFPPIGLPMENLASQLAQSIERYRPRLVDDRTGQGRHWPDGKFGELRRLSLLTQRGGGPAFVTE